MRKNKFDAIEGASIPKALTVIVGPHAVRIAIIVWLLVLAYPDLGPAGVAVIAVVALQAESVGLEMSANEFARRVRERGEA